MCVCVCVCSKMLEEAVDPILHINITPYNIYYNPTHNPTTGINNILMNNISVHISGVFKDPRSKFSKFRIY